MPVMRRNNAQNVIGETMNELLENFKWQISQVVKNAGRAGYFTNREELTGEHRTFVDEIMKGERADVNWTKALFELTEIVHLLTNRLVLLLIDEYDTPTSNAVRHGYFPEVCLVWFEMEHEIDFHPCML
jgi:hypothetical protein